MIDLSKIYKTRDGRHVELFTQKERLIYGILKVNNKWVSDNWFNDGSYQDSPFEHELDLIEVKEKKTVTGFLNIYRLHTSPIYESKTLAQSLQMRGIIACKEITIEYEEGEGL
jgi:hypothetical protein